MDLGQLLLVDVRAWLDILNWYLNSSPLEKKSLYDSETLDFVMDKPNAVMPIASSIDIISCKNSLIHDWVVIGNWLVQFCTLHFDPCSVTIGEDLLQNLTRGIYTWQWSNRIWGFGSDWFPTSKNWCCCHTYCYIAAQVRTNVVCECWCIIWVRSWSEKLWGNGGNMLVRTVISTLEQLMTILFFSWRASF